MMKITANQRANREAMLRWLNMGEQPENAIKTVDGFDIHSYGWRHQNRPACIAEAAVMWWGEKDDASSWDGAMDHLGIDKITDANALFFDYPAGVRASDAAYTLSHYFETGEVVWQK